MYCVLSVRQVGEYDLLSKVLEYIKWEFRAYQVGMEIISSRDLGFIKSSNDLDHVK